jgi:hypothetical protein
VREAYGKLYGDGAPQWEAWFNSGDVDRLKARAKHRDWLNEIEARIANIRAERKGEGRTLTPQDARALAGEWYKWFVVRAAAQKWSSGEMPCQLLGRAKHAPGPGGVGDLSTGRQAA